MKGTRFQTLRRLMAVKGLDNVLLAQRLGLARTTVSRRLNGYESWKLEEMYAILDLLQLPESELPGIFPRDGISIEPYHFKEAVS